VVLGWFVADADCGVMQTHAEPLYARVFLVSVS